jgi:hypothetical protein
LPSINTDVKVDVLLVIKVGSVEIGGGGNVEVEGKA